MNQATRVLFAPLQNRPFGTITGSYQVVEAVFAHPIRLLVVQNYTDADMVFSFDGVNDHMVLNAGDQIVFDFASDQSAVAGMWSLAIGDGVYVRSNGVAPTTGDVYVTGAYGKGE